MSNELIEALQEYIETQKQQTTAIMALVDVCAAMLDQLMSAEEGELNGEGPGLYLDGSLVR